MARINASGTRVRVLYLYIIIARNHTYSNVPRHLYAPYSNVKQMPKHTSTDSHLYYIKTGYRDYHHIYIYIYMHIRRCIYVHISTDTCT